MDTPTLSTVYAELIAPFPLELIELKPGKVIGKRALALAYADARAYQERLDCVVGPDNWSVEYRPLGEHAVVCRLTILGIVREDVGEVDTSREKTSADDGRSLVNPNAHTSAVAQAFKRACSAFGLGRYLYALGKAWVDYDPERKTIVNPDAVVYRLYAAAALLPQQPPRDEKRR